ncbi:catechol O-methyltransferase 2 [Penicillium hispanicum]|uniref:catechol O-methyltransferase 2 n=1 Tax=Penicillium hispanicum TaxID=1080232 RepID=UPI0025402D8E|nr:catechol O-methyltransferase 2 [Penicillium hispanicum]KAJ5573569.1 catechol O-methyltransferase 2 [Penicillium hispanicum]
MSTQSAAAPKEKSREEGRERKLLHFIYGQENLDEIRGHPRKVLDLMDKFEEDHHMMTVGPPKGKIITDLIDELKPKTMIELGCFVGYSAILFGDAVRRNGGERYLSLELNPELAGIANMLIELAGLRDFVRVIVGRSDTSLDKLYRTGDVTKIELMFIDHYKPAYTTDVKLCEHHGMIVPGSVLVADNVLHPGNPPYLEYVRSSVEQKREAAKNGPVKGYSTGGMAERTINSFMPQNDVPAFETVGNPNLIYTSELRQPEGERDALEVTRCVGIQDN